MGRIDDIHKRQRVVSGRHPRQIVVPSRHAHTNRLDCSPNSNKFQKRLSKSARILLAYERLETVGIPPKNIEAKKEKTLLNKVIFTGKKFKRKRVMSFAVIILLVGISVYSLVDTWLLNNKIRNNMKTATAAIKSDDPDSRQAAEGQDEKKISADSIDSYKVAADLPRVVKIDKINVRARVMQMGVNADGSMQSPINIYDAGWYMGSTKPGQSGASVVIAHANGPSSPGLFDNLGKLSQGDEVSIENGAGMIFKYQVVAIETVPLDKVDMDKFLRPVAGVGEGLNLMTCSGNWVQSSHTRDHRTIVYTKRM